MVTKTGDDRFRSHTLVKKNTWLSFLVVVTLLWMGRTDNHLVQALIVVPATPLTFMGRMQQCTSRPTFPWGKHDSCYYRGLSKTSTTSALRKPHHSLVVLAQMLDDTSVSCSAPPMHHTAIKTRDIELAIQFYSLFDYTVETKFLAGNIRAAWLKRKLISNNNNDNTASRLELLEVPSHMLSPQLSSTPNDNTNTTASVRAVDFMKRPELLGLNHYALDVTMSMKKRNMKDMQQYLDFINSKSVKAFGKTLRIAMPPAEQMIGQYLYQLAFLYDADGTIIELLYEQRKFPQKMMDGWYV